MGNVNLKINGLNVTAPAGSTILEAAQAAGIKIPTLCYLKEINEIGACRMCVVEVKGARNLVASCVHPVAEGMEVQTNTPKLLDSRRRTLELLLSNHDKKCLSCVRSGQCELQELCQELGVTDENYFEGETTHYELDESAVHMVRDNNKCILCRRCSAVCEKVQSRSRWDWEIQAASAADSVSRHVRRARSTKRAISTTFLPLLRMRQNML